MDTTRNSLLRKIIAVTVLGLSALALFMSLTACSSTAHSTAKITLEANGGTGYEWVNDIDQQQVVTLVDESIDASTNVAGGPVKSAYTLKAAKEGTAAITFTLSRSWEPSAKDEYVTYKFAVDKDMNITLVDLNGTYSNIAAPEIS
ncbi:MAG: protease inhibitor I42 family protein [Raoultibacter sp.]